MPVSLVVADFDRDGKPDAVVANEGRYKRGSLDFMRGNGDGTFAAPVQILQRNCRSVVTADFNQDGKQDVAAIDESGILHVLLGNGDGTFRESFTLRSVYNQIAGDWNRDGAPDLAVFGIFKGGVGFFVLTGNGDGTFEDPVKVGNNTDTRTLLKAADLNGDGYPDLVTFAVDGSGVLTIYFNTGHGAFSPGVFSRPGTGGLDYGAADLAFVDYNHDGKLDLLFCGLGSSFDIRAVIALGHGDGTFGPTNNIVSPGFYSYQIIPGDFNGDGKLDLGLLSTNGLLVLPGNGDGTFQPEREWVASGGGTTNNYGKAVPADVNGDGIMDVVVANGGTFSVETLLGNRDGSFQSSELFPIGSGSTLAVTGDFNGDGNTDVVVVGGDGGTVGGNAKPVTVALGSGDGRLRQLVEFTTNYSPGLLFAADLNNDGKLDLLMATYGSTAGLNYLSVFLGNGDGTFQAEMDYPLQVSDYNFASLTLADFNNDGKLDLAIADTDDGANDGLFIRFGNGDGSFGPPVLVSSAVAQAVFAADVNGDGKSDLVYYTGNRGGGRNGLLNVQLGNGDGTFGGPISSAVRVDRAAQFASGDFNGDGKLDLALISPPYDYGPELSAFTGDGAGHFTTSMSIPEPLYMNNLAVADFDGDGKADIMYDTAGGDNGPGQREVVLMTGKGDGTFQLPKTFLAGSGPRLALVADFNNDGAPDVVALNGGEAILLNTGGARVALASSLNPAPPATPITFTATIAASVATAGAPSGKVSFYDNLTLLGTATLAHGVASILVPGLPAGSHSITAAYAGNSPWYPAAATPLKELVN